MCLHFDGATPTEWKEQGRAPIFLKTSQVHSLKAVNDMVNDKNALSVNHTQLNLAESKSHSGIRAECILHMAVSIGVID